MSNQKFVRRKFPNLAEIRHKRQVAAWLLFTAMLVFAIIIVGGVTRLTESGLSITRWQVLTGIVPPISDAQWQEEFTAYKKIPQFKQVNSWMELADFKQIFWWEYAHRLLGRLIGLVYVVPFFWFLAKRRIPKNLRTRLWGILALGGLQGFIGWWMVTSGLSDRTSVAPLRLSIHLLLALWIYSLLYLSGIKLSRDAVPNTIKAQRLNRWTKVALGIFFIQVFLGAMTAGLDGGHAYSSWPLMGDSLIPQTLFTMDYRLEGLAQNAVLMHFLHRNLAWLLALLCLWISWHAAVDCNMRLRPVLLFVAVIMQFILGIMTVVSGVPLVIAICHQAGSVILLSCLLTISYSSSRSNPTLV